MMHINMNTMRVAVLATATALAITACGNVSQNIHKDGQSADSLVWPKVSDVTPMHRGGTFPTRDNLIHVRAGLNKQQIADLIGFPHFSEGVWGVREWNYVFNFRDSVAGESVVTCEFKILFNEQRIARSFYWNPSPCARYQMPDPMPTSVAPVTTERFTFSADALFTFDRSSISDITNGGREELNKLLRSMEAHSHTLASVRVIGYTDRVGGDAYNHALSLKRAITVKEYLVQRGVGENIIHAEGRGNADPVKDCPDGGNRGALISCLAPNRRVEILVESSRPVAAAD